jgi:hypothetical protein
MILRHQDEFAVFLAVEIEVRAPGHWTAEF